MVLGLHKGPKHPTVNKQDVDVDVTKHGLGARKKILKEQHKYEEEQLKLRLKHDRKMQKILEKFKK